MGATTRNAMQAQQEKEADGLTALMPFFRARAQAMGAYVHLPPCVNAAQGRRQGDVHFRWLDDPTKVLTIELKVDCTGRDTAFVETASNAHAERYRAGWYHTSEARILCYYWHGQDQLLWVPFSKLRAWGRTPVKGRTALEWYRRVQQRDVQQRNDTRGHSVPREALRRIEKAVMYTPLTTFGDGREELARWGL